MITRTPASPKSISPAFLGNSEELIALFVQAVELVEHELLGAVVDLQRAIAAAAPGAGLLRPFLRGGHFGKHPLEARDGAPAHRQPIRVES